MRFRIRRRRARGRRSKPNCRTSYPRRTAYNQGMLYILALLAMAAVGQGAVSFNRDVRPIMSDTCFRCHGPDRNARKADMRLDLRDDATRPTRSGRTPIVPGDPDTSQIIARIFATGANVMPPPYAHKELTQTQKET